MMCTFVVHNTAQNSSDNLLCYPADWYCADVVCWRRGTN